MMKKFPSNEPGFDPRMIRIGDTVRLCSSGPLMTVGRKNEPAGLLFCLWFVGFHVHSSWLRAGIVRIDTTMDCNNQGQDGAGDEEIVEEINYDDCPISDDDYFQEVEEKSCYYDDDSEIRELIEEMTEYTDALVRSNETGWFYDD